MKQAFLLVCALACGSSLCAQDVIFKRNGDELQALVLKVGDTEIEFKKWSNQGGPTYTMKKTDIFMIKYAGGDKDVFTETEAPKATYTAEAEAAAQPVQPVGELAKPAADNAELIEAFNSKTFTKDIGRKNSEASYAISIYGLTKSSVISSDEVEVKFGTVKSGLNVIPRNFGYYLILTNKTGQYLYIDRAGSSAGSDSYYNSKQATTTTGNTKDGSAGVNLGGVAGALGVGGVVGGLANAVTVGGGTSSTNVTTESFGQDRFLILPPMGASDLKRTDIWTDKKGAHQKDVIETIYYHDCRNSKLNTCGVKFGEVAEFDEKQSDYKRKFVITYSSDPTFATYKTMVFEVYKMRSMGCGNRSCDDIRYSLPSGTIHD